MATPPVAGQVSIASDRLYFFTSPIPTAACLIWAHGGIAHGAAHFVVPSRTTVHFYTPHGYTLNDPILVTNITTRMNEPVHDITGGNQCWNYSLSKALGMVNSNQGEAEYSNVKRLMDEAVADFTNTSLAKSRIPRTQRWLPHLVSPRKRWNSKSISLEEVINAVLAHTANTVTDFFVCACRIETHNGQVLGHYLDENNKPQRLPRPRVLPEPRGPRPRF